MKHFHKMDEKDFNKIKALLNVDISLLKIHEVTGRSTGTIAFIKRADSYADYKKDVAAYVAKYAKPGKEKANGVSDVTTYQVVARLDRIEKKLDKLVNGRGVKFPWTK